MGNAENSKFVFTIIISRPEMGRGGAERSPLGASGWEAGRQIPWHNNAGPAHLRGALYWVPIEEREMLEYDLENRTPL